MRRVAQLKQKVVQRCLFYERPSKFAMFLRVRNRLAANNQPNRVVVDAACQWGWNRELVFPSDIAYYGIDLRHDFLVRAKRSHPGDTFLNANILDLHRYFPENSVDCIVSTNTLEYLTPRERLKAIRVFHSLLKSDGYALLSLVDAAANAQTVAFARRLFSQVSLYRYRNPFSRAFEDVISDANGCYELHDFHRRLHFPLSLVAIALSRLEKVLAPFPFPFNQNLLVVCSGRPAAIRSEQSPFGLVGVVEDDEKVLVSESSSRNLRNK